LVDKYGPAISDPEISVIFVTEETKPTAIEINRIRKEHNLLLLEIVVVDPVIDGNKAVISSTNIRKMLHNYQKREN
jgi:pantetheine-phosphate adenylyltransferase